MDKNHRVFHCNIETVAPTVPAALQKILKAADL